MMSREDTLRAVHNILEQPNSIPLSKEALDLRYELLREETGELLKELRCLAARVHFNAPDNLIIQALSKVLDEMADVQIVLSGLAATFDLPLQRAFERKVDAQNTKVDKVTGRVTKDANGKTLKGPNYKKPDFKDLAELVLRKSKWKTEKGV